MRLRLDQLAFARGGCPRLCGGAYDLHAQRAVERDCRACGFVFLAGLVAPGKAHTLAGCSRDFGPGRNGNHSCLRHAVYLNRVLMLVHTSKLLLLESVRNWVQESMSRVMAVPLEANVFEQDANVTTRLEGYAIAWRYFLEAPLAGKGLGVKHEMEFILLLAIYALFFAVFRLTSFNLLLAAAWGIALAARYRDEDCQCAALRVLSATALWRWRLSSL